MAVETVFTMSNPHDTCTAAAYLWAHKKLRKAEVHAQDFQHDNDFLTYAMPKINSLDSEYRQQASHFGLRIIDMADGVNISSAEISEKFKARSPHVGLFWCSFHTMGYYYGHHDKQYFDNNHGLYKSKLTQDLIAFMDEKKTNYYQVPWCGYMIVSI
ncbi:hypothetical protein R3X27_05515 [Tropicimonas sp. TH_r6]|uniref:hypothetical protein n=1 Tax=Tropicimonas sp. TH_r6 TaxID=3082085 RepID=UPI002953B82A|nr:hypothetical protein [Tropicimonas sp. TH_r6]MDV7142136.1 hypothetical protein [Tropicimonas sp. TH_r6]